MNALSPDDLKKLSTADRMALISEIWNTFESAEVPMTAAQIEELDRRFETFEDDIQRAIPMEQVFAKLNTRTP